jgi:hypothetical protein
MPVTPRTVPPRRAPESLKNQGGQADPSTQRASLVGMMGSGSVAETPSAPTAGNPGEDLETSGRKVRADYTEVGSRGLHQYGGYVYEEFIKALQGDRGIKTFREMSDNDPVIGGLLFGIDMMARQVDWHLEPAFVPPPKPPAPGPPAMPIVGPGAQLPVLDRQHATEAERQQAEHEHQRQQATQSQIAQLGASAAQSGGPGARDRKNPIRKSFDRVLDRYTDEAFAESFPALDDMQQRIRKALGEPIVGDDHQVHQAEEAAAFVESCFLDMSTSWEEVVSAILSFIPFGWSYHEIVYKKRVGPDEKDGSKRSKFDDHRIGWRKIVLRAQDSKLRWEFDEHDGVVGMWQLAPGKAMQFLPINKCLLFRTTSARGNPEGRSAIRNAFVPWWFKKRIEETEAIGIERDLAGFPVAWVPFDYLTDAATPAQQQALDEFKRQVRNIRRDEQEGAVWPLAYDENGNKLYDLTLLSTGGQRQFDTDKIVSRYDQRIAMSVLADFILLGHENVGSKSLGSSKIDLFMAALEAWLYHIADVFNTHAIPRLLRLNGVDVRMAPKLTFGSIQPVDLDVLAKFLTAMAGAGMPLFPDEDLDSYLRTTAGLPAKAQPLPEDVEQEEL